MNYLIDNANKFRPTEDMDLWKVENSKYTITIKWSHNCFQDYRKLSYNFFECGWYVFNEVFHEQKDTIKWDTWFLTGVFLLRHSIELALKAVLCREFEKKNTIQETFKECKHDISALFQKYCEVKKQKCLSKEEGEWLKEYLISIEVVDKKSDTFRFPFSDEFISQYDQKILDVKSVINNILQAFSLVHKILERGSINDQVIFNDNLEPSFFVFADARIGNCYLRKDLFGKGFYSRIEGYTEVIDYIYNIKEISLENKSYPLICMLRNDIELYLKCLLRYDVEQPIEIKGKRRTKERSHKIKKDLWKYVRPVLEYYGKEQCDDTLESLDIVEAKLNSIDSLDENGDMFRYPTSYSLEYKMDKKTFDLQNVYEYMRAIINFLDTCEIMLSIAVEYEADM